MEKPLSVRFLGIVVLAIIVTAFGGLSFAQEEPKEPQGVPEEEVEVPRAVGEITVTARKIEENIQDVPVAVSTIQGEDLDVLTTGGADIRAISGRVPSLVMESSFGRAFPRFYIRGLGNTDFDLNASQPVSMVVDDVVLENPIVKGMPLFDIQQVEVLRGPQGTLFGRNTPAGVVKFDTVRPSQEFNAFAKVSYGTYSTMDVQAAVGFPISSTVSARLSAVYQSQNDWIENQYDPGPDQDLGAFDNTGYRAQLLWQPNEKFSGLLNLHGWDVDGTARIFRANIFVPGINDLVPGFDQEKVWFDGRNKQEISSFGGVLNLEYDFGSMTLTSITGYESIDDMYSRGDIDGGYGASFLGEGNYGPGEIPFASESSDGLPYLDQWTEEIRLASNDNEVLNWLVGFFYFDESLEADTYSYDSLADGADDGFSYQKQDATSYALFGTVDWQVATDWNVTAGIRFSSDEKDLVAQRLQAPFINTLLYGSGPTVEIPEHVEDDNVSWDLTAMYNVNQNFNLYGRLATSYRAPSIQGRILFCPDVDGTDPATNCVTTADTEDIISFEVGIKTILAENRLRFNLTGYVYEVDGQQVTAVGGEYNTATLLNVDKTEGYGLETDIQWTPTGHWLMTFGASWNPTKIKDPNLTVAPCGGGCTVTDPVVDGLAYVDGNPLPHAPDVIFNGIINWRSDPATKKFFATLDWAYYSEKNFFLYESEEFKGDSFELGLRVGYAFSNAKYEVALFARNLTDEVNVRGAIDFNNLTGYTNEPRIIGIELLGRF
ncbi:MAG: TonB-dependent receptor [Acidobacteriota bacterium]